MAYKCREEIVGKRFLSVSGYTKLKLGKISEWGWRAGVIRAASHKDNTHKDLQVILYPDEKLQKRGCVPFDMCQLCWSRSIRYDFLFYFFNCYIICFYR